MKWLESIGVILSFGGLIQLFKWILDSLNIKPTENTLTVFIASIFSLQLITILLLDQMQKENNEMKEFLKTKGFVENRSVLDKMINNKGSIDARILWLLAALIILYLLYKLFFTVYV